jgi:hypothetical protein
LTVIGRTIATLFSQPDRVGFIDIRLSFAIDAPGATAEDLEGLRRRTERYCVVQQTLLHPPAVSTSWSDPGAAQVG